MSIRCQQRKAKHLVVCRPQVKAVLDVPGMFKSDIKHRVHFELMQRPLDNPLPLRAVAEVRN